MKKLINLIFIFTIFLSILSAAGAEEAESTSDNSQKAQALLLENPSSKDACSAAEKNAQQVISPFRISQQEAEEIYKKWLQDSEFLDPSDLSSKTEDGGIEAIYLPYYSFSVKIKGNYKAKYSETREIRVKNKETRRYERKTETEWKKVSGTVSREFQNVLVQAFSLKYSEFLKNAEEFNSDDIQLYEAPLNCSEEKYAVNLNEAWIKSQAIFNKKIESEIKNSVKRRYKSSNCSINSVNLNFDEVKFRKIKLPFYIFCYRYNNKDYYAAVNGNSGKIDGNRPYSSYKILIILLSAAAAVLSIRILYKKLTRSQTSHKTYNI